MSHLEGLLDEARQESSLQAERLEEGAKTVEAAHSKTLAAEQKAASLQMDLASALDNQLIAAENARARVEEVQRGEKSLQQELQEYKRKVRDLMPRMAAIIASASENAILPASIQTRNDISKARQ